MGVTYTPGEAVYVARNARDWTGVLLFGPEDGIEYGYEFEFRPPFQFVAVGEDGDLIVADSGGEEMDVSPEYVSPEYADWELELLGDLNAPPHEPDDIVN